MTINKSKLTLGLGENQTSKDYSLYTIYITSC